MDGVAGVAAIVCDGGPVVLSIHIEGEGTRRPELLEGAVASGEGERLQVQLKAEGRREGDVEPRRQVELALVELPEHVARAVRRPGGGIGLRGDELRGDRKSTRLNSSHTVISYAVFCLKKKKTT